MSADFPGSPALQNFLRMLEGGKDGALLRFAIGNEYLKAGEPSAAALHFARAVALDPGYTAAWKLRGKALADAGRTDEAIEAYEQGIAVARGKGDRQAEKEMEVFVRRLRNAAG
ncbi:MAG: tetratricopeptide repeat protein [Casimicrobiaceae bacterium]